MNSLLRIHLHSNPLINRKKMNLSIRHIIIPNWKMRILWGLNLILGLWLPTKRINQRGAGKKFQFMSNMILQKEDAHQNKLFLIKINFNLFLVISLHCLPKNRKKNLKIKLKQINLNNHKVNLLKSSWILIFKHINSSKCYWNSSSNNSNKMNRNKRANLNKRKNYPYRDNKKRKWLSKK